jgi:hypothetical protein
MRFLRANSNQDTINRSFIKIYVLWHLGMPRVIYVDLQELGVTCGTERITYSVTCNANVIQNFGFSLPLHVRCSYAKQS